MGQAFTNYNFDLTEVSYVKALLSGSYRWVLLCFNKDTSCYIKKVDWNNLYTTFYTKTLEVDSINAIEIADYYYAYVAVEDDSIFAYKLAVVGGTLTSIPMPSEANESPIAVAYVSELEGSTIVKKPCFLTPGGVSGEPAKIFKYYNTTLEEVIELEHSGELITNAVSFTVDNNNELWVVTSDNPAKLVRVYQDSALQWVFSTTELS